MNEKIRHRIVVVGNKCIKNKAIRSCTESILDRYDVCFSDTGIEYAGPLEPGRRQVFVYDDFLDNIFARLNSKSKFIISPEVLLSASSKLESLTNHTRPLYNRAMHGVVVCFTGFKEREQISLLASLVHYMSGTIRKEFSPKVTHVVANHCRGGKYKSAVSLGTPIMQLMWIHHLWEKRDDKQVTAASEEMMQFRAPPFLSCGLAFHGFTESDYKEMEDIAMSNGGQLCQLTDPECTHLVVDNTLTLPGDINPSIYVVKAEWFWASVQIEACADEDIYSVQIDGRENNTSRSTPSGTRRYTPSRSKKRKRALRENLAVLASEGELQSGQQNASSGGGGGQGSYKSRRSSVDHLSVSRGFGDLTPDSSGCLLDSPSPTKKPRSPSPEPKSSQKQSARKLVVGELLQTETNYCGILSNVLTIFRDEAERLDQPGGPILSHTDSKIIFGKIPPILEIHQEIKDDLEIILNKWTDDNPVAGVVLDRVEKLRITYPPFVNYFEETKKKIDQCVKRIPRFHAFMKVCERKPECGRQALSELMMTIVQRLPRIELLLDRIHKYTDKKLSDYTRLEQAQQALKEVMTHINEDKRLTDERMVLFDIMNDIENCPPNLLSANRNFVHRVDVSEVSDLLIGRGEHLTLFIFTDSLEIVKRRHKSVITPFKSPAAPQKASSSSSNSKPFKHVEFLSLPSIKRVIDITQDEDGFTESSSSLFALICRQVTDTKERLYSFQLPDAESVDKYELLTSLAKNIANCCCRADYESMVTALPAAQLMVTPISPSANNKTMTRAVSKFGKRLSRAMTIKGTPSRLKRAVSSIMTPTRRSSMRKNDVSSSTMSGSVWDLDDPVSPSLAGASPIAYSYASLPRNSSILSNKHHRR